MSHAAPLARLAGPAALAAGVLLVAAEMVMWTFDPKAHVATTTDPVDQVAGAVYFLGFWLLLVALVASYAWQARAAGRLGVVALCAALLGTLALGGDQWFEGFAVPWIADRVPSAFDTTPTTVLGLGAISSYFTFAFGWALYGLASLRARVFPAVICWALTIGGVLGWRAPVPPAGAGLGLVMAWLGIWMIRATTAAAEPVAPLEPGKPAEIPKGAVPAPRSSADAEDPARTAPRHRTARP